MLYWYKNLSGQEQIMWETLFTINVLTFHSVSITKLTLSYNHSTLKYHILFQKITYPRDCPPFHAIVTNQYCKSKS
jgi:hypothetical protein